MELSIIHPPPIKCYYYVIEEVKGGHKVSYLYGIEGNKLGFKSLIINSFDSLPSFIVERLPSNLIGNSDEIFKEFLQRV